MFYEPISCDTLVAMGAATKNGGVIFAKNSDRNVTEAQPLEAFPAADHAAGEKLKCTHITIDQAPHTYRMIGSRPWWIWGFEHGANEHGVVIGNEAAFANIPEEEADGLIGMDLLRLGLERGKTADDALGVITGLLERYGQGGSCSYGGGGSYHNLFLIADRGAAWVLETVNRRWAAKKVEGYGCISNLYGIGEKFDKSSEGLAEYAVSMGLHDETRAFDFAKSFTLLQAGKMSGFARARRMRGLLKSGAGDIDVAYVKRIMRDHFEGELIEPQWSPAEVCNPTICMHGAGPGAGQTAASVILEFHDCGAGVPTQENIAGLAQGDVAGLARGSAADSPATALPPELAFTYWGCLCPPCTSFYMPFFNTGYIPDVLSRGETNKYSDSSFWWRNYRLTLAVEANYEKHIGVVREAQAALEDKFEKDAADVYEKAAGLFGRGDGAAARKLLNDFMDRCAAQAKAETDRLTAELEAELSHSPGQIYKAQHVRDVKRQAEMP